MSVVSIPSRPHPRFCLSARPSASARPSEATGPHRANLWGASSASRSASRAVVTPGCQVRSGCVPRVGNEPRWKGAATQKRRSREKQKTPIVTVKKFKKKFNIAKTTAFVVISDDSTEQYILISPQFSLISLERMGDGHRFAARATMVGWPGQTNRPGKRRMETEAGRCRRTRFPGEIATILSLPSPRLPYSAGSPVRPVVSLAHAWAGPWACQGPPGLGPQRRCRSSRS